MLLNKNELLRLNPYSSDLKDVCNYTIVNTRPDLKIENRSIIDFFSNRELENVQQWQDGDFNYNISSLGFRDIDLPNELDIAAFGCSITFGQGMPAEMIWPTILGQSLNKSVYNFGQPAASTRSILDIFLILSQHIKIKKAIFLFPTYYRYLVAATHIINDKINLISVLPSYVSHLQKLYNFNSFKFYEYFPNSELLRIFKDCVYTLEFICKINNIEMYCSSWDHTTYENLCGMNFTTAKILPEWASKNSPEFSNDLARDLVHPGKKHHISWSEKIIYTLNP